MRKAVGSVAIGCALACGLATPAAADSEPSAQALFTRGIEDLKAKRFDTACPALRKSFQLDARPETLFSIARCEEDAGRITTAAATYDDYFKLYSELPADQKREENERERTASARREALENDIPHVTFRLPPSAPDDVRVTRRSRDGGDPIDVMVGARLPIDPGEHFVSTEAPGRAAWEKRFFIDKRQELNVELSVAPPDKTGATRFDKPVPPVPDALPSRRPVTSGQRITAYVSGGVGIAGAVAGLIAGGVVWSAKGTIDDNCENHFCNKVGMAAADRAKASGLASTALLIVGAVGVGVGIVLYFTDAEPEKYGAAPSRMTIGLNTAPAGATMGATWAW